MGKLYRTRTYLIGSMEYENGESWRTTATNRLSKMGITVFDPYHKPFIEEIKEDDEARMLLQEWRTDGKYDLLAERMKQVRSDDLRLCDISDFFIVYINPKVASWGSAEELYWCNRLKKPIFVVVEGGKEKCPLWLFGVLPHRYIYSSLEEALVMLEQIDAGVKDIDSGRWRLLKEELR